MGQRLNIEIQNNGKLLANCYYHWFAYTDCSMEIATDALDAYYEEECANLTPKQKALYMLNATNATVQPEEIRAVRRIMKGTGIKFNTDANRNEGLICVTKTGTRETRLWAEYTIVIDIRKETVDFGVFSNYDEDELAEDDCIEDLNYYTREIPFSDWDSFRTDLEDVKRFFRDLDDDCIMGKIM